MFSVVHVRSEEEHEEREIGRKGSEEKQGKNASERETRCTESERYSMCFSREREKENDSRKIGYNLIRVFLTHHKVTRR